MHAKEEKAIDKNDYQIRIHIVNQVIVGLKLDMLLSSEKNTNKGSYKKN